MKKQILTQQDRKINFAQKQWILEDQALGHYAIQVDRFPDLIAVPSTSFQSVKAIAKIYAEIDNDFRTIFNDMNMLIEIDKKLKKRIETETVFRIPPTSEEIEGLLLWLNKEQLPQA